MIIVTYMDYRAKQADTDCVCEFWSADFSSSIKFQFFYYFRSADKLVWLPVQWGIEVALILWDTVHSCLTWLADSLPQSFLFAHGGHMPHIDMWAGRLYL